jgi:hypothetical protein
MLAVLGLLLFSIQVMSVVGGGTMSGVHAVVGSIFLVGGLILYELTSSRSR